MLKNLFKFYAQQAGPAWFRIVFFLRYLWFIEWFSVDDHQQRAIQARFDNALSTEHAFQFVLLLSVFLLSTHFAMKLGVILSSEMMHDLRVNPPEE